MRAETTDKQKDFVRVQFDFSQEALRRLDAIKARILATTRAETVRAALRFYEWFLNEIDPDNIIIIQDKDGKELTKAKASLFLGLASPLQSHTYSQEHS